MNNLFRRRNRSLFLEPLEDRALMATLTVNSNLDTVAADSVLTLREAIAITNAQSTAGRSPQEIAQVSGNVLTGNVIQFDAALSGQTITLSGSRLTVTKPVSINGLGADKLTIDGNNASQILFVDGRTNGFIAVSLRNLKFAHGNANGSGGTVTGGVDNSVRGGAIFNDSGLVSIESSYFTQNSATFAGAIYNFGNNMDLNNSTIYDNSASAATGGVTTNGGTLVLTNCTVSGNDAQTFNGGVNNAGGSVIIAQSTIVDNTIVNANGSTAGAGVYTNAGTTVIENSVVAGNLDLNFDQEDIGGLVNVSGNNNFVGTTASGGLVNGANGNIVMSVPVSVSTLVSALANNGGPVPTHLPLPNSPLLDKGSNADATGATDQRGAPRIVDGPDVDTTATIDIGAVEYQGPAAELIVRPGGSGVGILSVTGNVTWNAGTTFSVDLNRLNASPAALVAGTDYDRLQISGSITLGNAALDGVIDSSGVGILTASPNGPDTFTILTYTGVRTGKFASNDQVFIQGRKFLINYDDLNKQIVLTKVQANVSLAIASSSNPSVFGQPVNFTVTVSPNEPNVPALPVPTGTVDIFDNGNLVVDNGALSGSGTFVFTTANSSVGTHTITATYNGNGQYLVNNGALSPNQVVQSDGTSPTVTIGTPGTATNSSSISFPVTFSEPVVLSGSIFNASQFLNLTNATFGTATNISVNGMVLNVNATGQGPVTLQMLANWVQDAAGNGSAASNIASIVYDSVAPTITAPANLQVSAPFGANSTTVNFAAPTFGDNRPGAAVQQTAGLPSGSAFPLGVTTNTFVVTDAAGNTASASFTITVLAGLQQPGDSLIAFDPPTGRWFGTNLRTGVQKVIAQWPTNTTWRDGVVADFNGDGNSDLAARHRNGKWYVGLAQPGNVNLFGFKVFGSSTLKNFDKVQVADVNNDGKADIIGYSKAAGARWYIFKSTGAIFTPQVLKLSTADQRTDYVIADFTGDGRTDFGYRTVAKAPALSSWFVHTASTQGTFAAGKVWGKWSAIAYKDVQPADYNGDGKQDIVGRDPATGKWRIAQSTGRAFVSRDLKAWQRDASAGWKNVKVGDFNKDGKDEIIGQNKTGNWFTMRQNGTVDVISRSLVNWANADQYKSVFVADLNRDGRDELIGRRGTTGKWRIDQLNVAGTRLATLSDPLLQPTWDKSVDWLFASLGKDDGNLF